MARRDLRALAPFVALLSSVSLCALALAACSGDDIELAPKDAGVTHDGAVSPVDATLVEAAVDAGIDSGCAVFDASALDPSLVMAGKALVTANKCQQCHGGNLGGNDDGVMGQGGSQAYPPNLTNDQTTGLGCWSNADIARAILDGIDNQGARLCPPMPLFGDAGVTQAQADEIVEYLRSLEVQKNQVPPTVCAAPADAGEDATPPVDSGVDSPGAVDAGVDAPATTDAGLDAGEDAGLDGATPVDAADEDASDGATE